MVGFSEASSGADEVPREVRRPYASSGTDHTFEASWGQFWGLLGHVLSLLGASFGPLGACLGPLGGLLGTLGGLLGHSWGPQGLLEAESQIF